MDSVGNCRGDCGDCRKSPLPAYGKAAPTEEAHSSAKQLRAVILKSLEAAIENDWVEVKECCDEVKMLAEHCSIHERSGVIA